MKVIIAEKPSVARDIARVVGATVKNDGYLEGSGYAVTWRWATLSALPCPKPTALQVFRGKIYR